jgi:hypothetical protein
MSCAVFKVVDMLYAHDKVVCSLTTEEELTSLDWTWLRT